MIRFEDLPVLDECPICGMVEVAADPLGSGLHPYKHPIGIDCHFLAGYKCLHCGSDFGDNLSSKFNVEQVQASRAANKTFLAKKPWEYCDAFQQIAEFYGERKAERSQVPLINHIAEGCSYLYQLSASTDAIQAFCLHPMFQGDDQLSDAVIERYVQIGGMRTRVLALVMEYRNIANQYLSHRTITNISEIKLSPLPDVNLMLIADKVQNQKDFHKYHLGTHPRSAELDRYFKNWLSRLGVSEYAAESLVHWDYVHGVTGKVTIL